METEKHELLRKFNQAFVDFNTEFILNSVTDDIVWTMVGEDSVQGKSEFANVLENMKSENQQELVIHHIITHGSEAAVDGIVKAVNAAGEEKTYAFCDIYRFSGFKNPKIKEMISYGIEVKQNQGAA
jgi:limonene-1,2-epoxide hydrolase